MHDPNGALPANVGFEGGFGCVATGFMPAGGMIDASSPCPPGMTMEYNMGSGGSLSWTMQAFLLFSDIDPDLIADWEYTRTPWKYEISIAPDVFSAIEGNGLLQVPIVLPNPATVDRLIKITLGLGAIELIKDWWKNSRRLTTVTVRCTAHLQGTPNHANDGNYYLGTGTGSTYWTARKAAERDAQAKVDARYGSGRGWHVQHCGDVR
jgi:hypothetical protein